MESYIKELIKEIELRGLAKSTKSAYLRHVKRFFSYYETKDPKDLDLKEIKNYLHHLQLQKPHGRKTKRAASSVNGAASAISFFYRFVCNRNYSDLIPRMKAPKLSPTILSIEEVNLMIDTVHNVFWKAILMTLYTTGMRQAELRNLKVTDIDSKRMVIYIKNAKGAKDRQAVLGPKLLTCLRTYWKVCRTKSVKSDYLFIATKNLYNGELKKSLSHTAVGYIVKRAAEIAGVKKKFTLTV